ncbi:MAG: right-handed parallel beta-helix repeat-containing protein [Phycisphaerae bacterium]|nr:right-handed parallel beta-helix repeat-containing protein [Phycisphaerae bacterium]
MKRAIVTIAAVVLVSAGSAGVAVGKVIYVDGRASGADNGTCWADAYVFLQDALSDANDSEKPVEVWVAQGIYRPDRSTAEPNGTGDREATFRLVNGVAVLGGYGGIGEADPNTRDIALYETVLSGDLDGNDVDVNDLGDLRDEPSRAENAYHVVTSRDSNESAVLDGMTITGGNANGYDVGYAWPHEERGGGMYNEGGGSVSGGRRGLETIVYAATIRDCTFIRNSGTFGGGMYNYQSYPRVLDCSFVENSSPIQWAGEHGWGGVGGGMCNEESSPLVSNCVFSRNLTYDSSRGGGGMHNDESSPVVSDCVFVENRASDGGGMFNKDSYPIVTRCVFSRNRSSDDGGAMYNSGSNVIIENCTFVGNTSGYIGGGMATDRGGLSLTNCVFAGNRARSLAGAMDCSRCQATVVRCTIAGNRTGGNGGGIVWRYGSEGSVSDSILWENSAALAGAQLAVYDYLEATTLTVEYCLVMGGEGAAHVEPNDGLDWGDGNIDGDPCFADPGYWDPNGTPDDENDDFWVDGDYHVKSQGGRWSSVVGAWVIDSLTSPCIDAGDPMTPIGPEPFPNGGIINMGAYGGTAEASKSWFGGPPCETIVAGDVNGDCIVDFRDFRIMALHWLEDR